MTWVDGVVATDVPADDRGLNYGDGVFETMRVVRGEVPLLARHLARLLAAGARLGFPALDDGVLRDEIDGASRGQDDAVLKLVVTRGSAGRGYRAPSDAHPRRVLSLHPRIEWPGAPHTGAVRVRSCATRLAIGGPLAGLKHLNRLEQVMARSEWQDAAIAEGVMCDAEGMLVGGTMSNLFLVLDGVLVTPRIDRCGVAGIARALVIEQAVGLGLRVAEQRVRPESLAVADEAFLCNAVVGIRPMAELDGRALPPAPMAMRLREHLAPQGLGA